MLYKVKKDKSKEEIKEVKVKKKYKSWTKEDEEHLKNLIAMGVSVKEIAIVFERGEKAVRAKMSKMGIKLLNKEEIPEGHKRCSRCKEILPFDHFNKNKGRKTGRDDYCKMCKSQMGLERKAKKIQEKEEAEREEQRKKDEGKTKTCKICKQEFPLQEFRNKDNTLRSYCKKCNNQKRKENKIKQSKEKGYY